MKLSNFVDNILWRAGLYFPWCLLNLSQYFSTDAVNSLNYVKEIKTVNGFRMWNSWPQSSGKQRIDVGVECEMMIWSNRSSKGRCNLIWSHIRAIWLHRLCWQRKMTQARPRGWSLEADLCITSFLIAVVPGLRQSARQERQGSRLALVATGAWDRKQRWYFPLPHFLQSITQGNSTHVHPGPSLLS